jgi:hypothetical protein
VAAPAFAIENASGSPNIDGISPFQVHIIYLDTFLQYFPNSWIRHTCSSISRYRNGAPKSTRSAVAQIPQPVTFYSSSP